MVETMDPERLAPIREVAARHVGDDRVPGLVVLVVRGDQTYAEPFGSQTIGGPPMQRDSLFRISSMTKPVTGTATLALASEGLLSLDQPIGELVPELARPRVLRRADGPLEDTVEARRAVTVRDLLTFTHGFGMAVEMFMAPEPWPVVTAAEQLELATLGPPDPDAPPDRETWIARLGSLPLIAQPGERWLYNTGATVLGVLLARAAAMPFDEVLRTRVFEPLAMTDTAFFTSELSRFTATYAPGPDGLTVWDPPEGRWSRRPANPDGAAGLVSSADDMAALARALLDGGRPILDSAAVAEMTRNQLSAEQLASSAAFLGGDGWGLCQSVVVEGPRAGAFGWNGGLGTSWLVDPARDLAVIVMTNRMFDSPGLPQVHRDVRDAVYEVLA